MWRLLFITMLCALWVTPVWAHSEPGRGAFERHGCHQCHATSPPPPGWSVADRVAEKGPNLWYAGSKFQRDWLHSWLADPLPVSLIRHDRLLPDTDVSPHPKLTGGDLDKVVAYLMTLTDPDLAVGEINTAEPMDRMNKIQGRILFGKEQQCFGCHKTVTRYGQEVGGSSAPSLASAYKRLNPDWIYAFLMDQKRYTPITRMPIYRGDTYTDYGEAQMRYLARYLAEMGKPRRGRR